VLGLAFHVEGVGVGNEVVRCSGWSDTVIMSYFSATLHFISISLGLTTSKTYTEPLVFRQSIQSAPLAPTLILKIILELTTDGDGQVFGKGELNLAAIACSMNIRHCFERDMYKIKSQY